MGMYLVDVVSIRTFNFDGMRRKLGIQAQGTTEMFCNEFRVDPPFREDSEQMSVRERVYEEIKHACL